MIGTCVRWSKTLRERRSRRGDRDCGRSRRRVFLEQLEDRVVPSGIVNGDFSISNPSDPNYGWTTRGNATIANGEGILNEGTIVQTEFSQSFTIAPGTTTLQFTIVASSLVTNGISNPPDAFEAALLNTQTNQPLVGPPTGLANTDSFLNIQQTGEVFYAPQVTVPGAGASGSVATLQYPEIVTVDLSSVPANTQATLYFDLIGFSPASSSVRVTSVSTPQGPTTPPVSFSLDPATDSGQVGDNITNINPVNLLGVTSPGQAVSLNVNGGGFNTTTTADSTGHFSFDGVTLTEGANPVQVKATNAQGDTIASQTITLDTQQPTGSLVNPAPGSTTSQDLGYVDVQWTAHGAAALDPTTFQTTNVTITGVTVGQDEDLGGGLVRYLYNQGGGVLSPGLINVVLVGGQVADLAGNVNSQTSQSFTIQASAPVASDQSVTTAQDEGTPITLTGTDTNTPPLTLTYIVTANPGHGMLSGAAPGLTYTPAPGYFGPDSFQFQVNNGLVDSNVATVSLTVVGKPVANAQSVSTPQSTTATITLAGTDPNTPPLTLTYIVTANPAHGTLLGTAPNLFYTPATGYLGPDSLQFKVNNGTLDSSVATVSITVVGQPAANAQSVTTGQSTATAITLTGTDPNTPPRTLTYSVTTSPVHGLLSGTAPDLTYTPATGYFGPDSLQFKVNNGTLDSNVATVTITVVGQPTASAGLPVTTAQGTSTPITLTGSDPNTPPLPLTYTVTTGPAHGTLTGTAPTLTYTPTAGYFGPDSFQFKVNNGTISSNIATVSITVTSVSQPPITNDDTYTTVENRPLTVAAPGVLANDVPSGAGLTAVLVSGPSHGSLALKADGSFTYTPAAKFTGSDTFTYMAVAGTVQGNVAVVHLTITPSRLLPDTPYYNDLRARRSIDPPRFDFYHPVLGALLGLEITGIPTTPATIVSANDHFNTATARALHARDAQQFDLRQPVLGALFTLEEPGTGAPPTHLLPQTPHYDAIRALYNQDPTQFQRKNVYLGAILALENIENSGRLVLQPTTAQALPTALKIGSVHPVATGRAFRMRGV
ncbi:MAG: Ig-like domain-containing protein [Isosphaerales bacterium]